MVYRRISADIKRRALQLLEQRWEIEEIADTLGVSTKSIPQWQTNYDNHGCINPPSVLWGRHQILKGEVIADTNTKASKEWEGVITVVSSLGFGERLHFFRAGLCLSEGASDWSWAWWAAASASWQAFFSTFLSFFFVFFASLLSLGSRSCFWLLLAELPSVGLWAMDLVEEGAVGLIFEGGRQILRAWGLAGSSDFSA